MKIYTRLARLVLMGTLFVSVAAAPQTIQRPTSSSSTPWPQYGLTANHTSFNTLERTLTPGSINKLTLKWAGEVGAAGASAAVVGQGMVFAMANGTVFAFRATDGTLAWSHLSCSGTGTVQPALGPQSLLVGDTGGDLAAYDPATGNQQWCRDESGSITSAPAVDSTNVYITNGASVIAVDQATGNTLWNFTPSDNSPVTNTPAVSNGVVYATGGSSVFALSGTSGQLLWRASPAPQYNISAPAVAAGIVYVGGVNLYALNASDGSVLWTQTAAGVNVTMPAIANSKVFVNSQDPRFGLFAFNAGTGALLWRNIGAGESGTTPTVANGVVYDVSDTGNLVMFNMNSGNLVGTVSDPNGHPYNSQSRSQVVVLNGVVYVSTADFFGVNQVDALGLP